MPSDSTHVALRVTDTLERLAIVYAVEGSIASSDYGIARSTVKANIIADMRPEHVAPLVAALSIDFYADPHMIENAIREESHFTLVHYGTKFNVDVSIPKQRPFDQMRLKRRIASVISSDPPRQVSVTTPEDAVLSKLERYRAGGESSYRDFREVLGASKIADLDLAYLRHWAKELQVEDLLARALKGA